jgi:DNA processing protein
LSGPGQAQASAPSSPLLPCLGFEAVTVDELVQSSGLDASMVMAELSTLELEGAVVRCAGGYIRS